MWIPDLKIFCRKVQNKSLKYPCSQTGHCNLSVAWKCVNVRSWQVRQCVLRQTQRERERERQDCFVFPLHHHTVNLCFKILPLGTTVAINLHFLLVYELKQSVSSRSLKTWRLKILSAMDQCVSTTSIYMHVYGTSSKAFLPDKTRGRTVCSVGRVWHAPRLKYML